MKKMHHNAVWKFFSTFWGVLYLSLVCIDFFMGNMYAYVLGPLGVVYLAALIIFVGSKECDRWCEQHHGSYRGEIFVFVFTIILFGMLVFSFIQGEKYEVSLNVVATYIAILSLFIVSQKSKAFHERKKVKEQ